MAFEIVGVLYRRSARSSVEVNRDSAPDIRGAPLG